MVRLDGLTQAESRPLCLCSIARGLAFLPVSDNVIPLKNIYFVTLFRSDAGLSAESISIDFAEQRSSTCAKEFPPELLA